MDNGKADPFEEVLETTPFADLDRILYPEDYAGDAASNERIGDAFADAALEGQLDAFAFATSTPADAPRARVTDPTTSHVAATRAGKGVTLKQLAVLDLFQRAHGVPKRSPMTHEQLVERFRAVAGVRGLRGHWYPKLTDSSIRTRCKELVTAGYVVHVDNTGTTATGGKAARWAVSTSGKMIDVDRERARHGVLPLGGAAR